MTALILKIIAYVSMFIDHIGYLGDFSDTATAIMRGIGRLSFPLFAFLVSEGYRHTRSKIAYLFRLIIFGLISIVPYSLCLYGKMMYFGKFNILFTLAAGVVCIAVLNLPRCFQHRSRWQYYTVSLLSLAAVIILSYVCARFNFEYGMWGILLICVLYLCRDYRWLQGILVIMFACQGLPSVIWGMSELTEWGVVRLAAALASIPIFLYNGKQGMEKMSPRITRMIKYSFYAIYPVHLLVFWMIF